MLFRSIPALTVLNAILGSGMSSRLFQKVREDKALVYSVYSTIDQNSDAGSIETYMSSTEENTMEAINTAVSVLRNLRDNGLTKGEMQRSKNLIKGVSARQMESTTARVYRMARRFMLTGVPEPIEERMKKIEKVTEEDVMNVAGNIIKGKNLALSIYGPKSKTLDSIKIEQFDL